MAPSPSNQPPDVFGWGAWYGMLSSLGYTAANVCLRDVSSHNPIWVAFIKSLPTMALTLPWLLVLLATGRGIHVNRRQFWLLIIGGVVGQLGGNVSFQWSLDVIGLALAVPVTTGSLIVAGALMAKVFLGETPSFRNVVANAVLVVAVCILSIGANDAFQAIQKTTDDGAWSMAVLGVIAAIVPGIAYSVQNIFLRRMFSNGVNMPSALLTISTTGAAVAFLTLYLSGDLASAVERTDREVMFTMVAAGVFNAGAFVALSVALRLTPIWFVYALSSSQVAMAAAIGVWMFDEPLTWTLIIGVSLTVVGLMAVRPSKPKGLPVPATQPISEPNPPSSS